jgi:membrane protein implicated in regulation of membrane protease activity
METLKDFVRPEVIWFLVGIVLLILEFVMPGLIISFFGLGACIVALVCLLSDYVQGSINAQLGIFVVSSIASLLLLRKWLRAVFVGHVVSKQDTSENLKEYIGEKAVVTACVTPAAGGKVEFHGTHWRAEAVQNIPEGTVVEIIGKENITLKVRPLDQKGE